jgi:hypothetical protein
MALRSVGDWRRMSILEAPPPEGGNPLGTTRIRRVGVVSLGMWAAAVYGGLGLLMGLVAAFATLFGLSSGSAASGLLGGLVSFGVAAVIVAPLVYGICGFLTGVLGAALYNLGARFTGGVEIELS